MRGLNGFLDSIYDSRSRFYIETQNLCDQVEARHFVHQAQNEFLEENRLECDKASVTSTKEFATFDGTLRSLAIADLNVLNLVEAARTVEEQPASQKPEVLPNTAAEGLQLLATLAEEGRSAVANLPISSPASKPTRTDHVNVLATASFTTPYGFITGMSTTVKDGTVDSKQADSRQSLVKHAIKEPVFRYPEAATMSDVPNRPSCNRITDILNKDQESSTLPRFASKSPATTRESNTNTILNHGYLATQLTPEFNSEHWAAQAQIPSIAVDAARTDNGYAASVPILPRLGDNVGMKEASRAETSEKPAKIPSGFWSKLSSKSSQNSNARKASVERAGFGLSRFRRLTSRDPSPDKSSEASSNVAPASLTGSNKPQTESPAPRVDNATVSHHLRRVSGSIITPYAATGSRPPVHPIYDSHRRPWNPEQRYAPATDAARRATIAVPQQYAIHAASPPAYSPLAAQFPQPHIHTYQVPPPRTAPAPFSAQAATPQPPLQFSQPLVTTPQAYGFQSYASPYISAHASHPNGYAQPLSAFWPATRSPQFLNVPPVTAVNLQPYMPATAAAAASGLDPRFPPYNSYPVSQPQFATPPYSAPAQYNGPQYGGQPILPANMIPQHGGPTILPASMAPQNSQYSGLPYGQQPHPPPAFSQQQAQIAGPLPNGQPYGHHAGGPRRRHRNFSGHPHKEFRPYNGPR